MSSTFITPISTTLLNPTVDLQILGFHSPLEAATHYIDAKYNALGSAGGLLGAPSGNISPCPDGVGFFRHFAKNASIYWTAATGAHAVRGALRDKWSALGWERSLLGYPVEEEATGGNPQTAGLRQAFQGGLLLNFGTTTHEVHGAILDKYLELGAEASILGYPATDETACPDNIGRYNHFQAGSIYWTPSTGAHEVHGLIRDFWAQHGWERNAALGYPLSDEAIPDRRIGHVRAEAARKPILNLPPDVVKLPVEAAVSGAVSRSAVNVVTGAKRFGGAEQLAGTGLIGVLTPQAASTEAPDRSVNRFSDFESGVLFWQRGSSAASQLNPWLKAADGTDIQKNPADMVAATMAHVGNALQVANGVPIPAFAGTSGYNWDGAGAQNRQHRILVTINALPSGFPPIPHVYTVTLFVLAAFEPERRKISAYLTGYTASDPLFTGKLDALLWTPFDVVVFPDTNGGKPYSILSVKTMANGDVNTFIEPEPALLAVNAAVDPNLLHTTVMGGNH